MRDPWKVNTLTAGPIRSNCITCDKVMIWRQAGDIPKYCDNCYHAAKGREKIHTAKWDKSIVPEEGDFLDRIDNVIHYSSEINRWFLREPDRWVGCSEIEVERIFSWLWWLGKKPTCDERQDEVELYRKMLDEYKNLCIERSKASA